jgi:DNA modification methylase
MSEIEFRERQLDELKPDPHNPRTHSRKQVEQIAASVSENGFVNPILINPDGVIIAGHGRYQAARLLDLSHVPTTTVRGLTRGQEKRLRIADNKIALNAGWDLDLLRVELAGIEAEGLDLELTGFSIGELDARLKSPVDPDDELIPAVPEHPVSRPGDIWVCGDHRVGCGNVLDGTSIGGLMAGTLADAVFTDPPYNVKVNGHVNARGRHREFAMASGEMSSAQFRQFLAGALGACVAVSRDGTVHFVFMDWRHALDLMSACEPIYGEMLNLCVWDKRNAGMGSLYRSKHELVFVYRVGTAPHLNAVELGRHGRNRTNIWSYTSVNSFAGSRRQDLALHPTVKPVALVADAIRDVTRRGGIVLDCFLGSGTSLLAAELTGRKARGLEIAPAYVDVAIMRWMTMTGREVILEGTGERFSGRRMAADRV